MKFTIIGETGVELPQIIFGTSALGNLYSALDDDIKLRIVKECFASLPGRPVVFDSAGKYGAGMALEVLGQCLEKLGISEQDVTISNKLGWLQTPLTGNDPSFESGVWFNLKYDAVQEISYEGILKCWEQGNKLLGGKYRPSLLSIHDPDEYLAASNHAKDRDKRYAELVGAYSALTKLKADGKVKALGIGAKNWKIIRELSVDVNFDWIMIANSLTIFDHQKELLDFIDLMIKKGITVINSAVFNAGFLVGGNYFNYKLADPANPKMAHLFEWREKFFSLCDKHSVSPSHACIHFGKSYPGIAALALNTSKPENVKKNVFEVSTNVSGEFFADMKAEGLIDRDFTWV